MLSQDSLSRRLGPVFAEIAAQAANAQQGPKSGQQGVENPNPMSAPSEAYKPAHGGLPKMTHDGAYIIVIPMARWHQAANDDHCGEPLRTA